MAKVEPGMESMLEMYIFETNTLLEQLDEILLRTEDANVFSQEDINEIFRIMHTIKGSSAMMGFENLQHLAHKGEDMFFVIREKPEIAKNAHFVYELIFEVSDLYKAEIEYIQNSGDDDYTPTDFSETFKKLEDATERLKAMENGAAPTESAPTESAPAAKQEASAAPAGSNVEGSMTVRVFFEDGCKMENLRAFLLLTKIKDVAEVISCTPPDVESNADTAKDIVENGFLVTFKGFDGDNDTVIKAIEGAVNVESYEIIDTPSAAPAEEKPAPAPVKEAAPVAAPAKTEEKPQAQPAPAKPAPAKPVPAKPAAKSAVTKAQEDIKKANGGQKHSLISVNLSKLDTLHDIVGEIITTESMVIANPDLEGLELESFSKAARQLRKLTDELQDTVMSIRMVPLAGVFQKMGRIVRDMKIKLNKEAELVLEGETTEVDKSIVDNLNDPLMHLVRNCMDHGIEDDINVRIAEGKPEKGTVKLSAKHSAGEVIITVSDDGAGINCEKVLEKAKESGLLTKPESEYTTKEIQNMILLPGFSTNDTVTEYSGRGVGMDVVRSNIEQCGGTLTVESEEGKGSSFIIRIPLTLAIVEGMKLKVGSTIFTVPISSIKESLMVANNQLLHDTKQGEMIMIRGVCYPILRLHEKFNMPTEVTKLEDGILLLVDVGGKNVCLFADKLIGEQPVVVKPFPKYLSQYNIKAKSAENYNDKLQELLNTQKAMEDAKKDPQNTVITKVLTFYIDDQVYGIEIPDVIEIIEVPPITAVPGVPSYIKGIINVRSKIVPVVNIRSRFGKEEIAFNDRTCIIIVSTGDVSVGLIVDSVADVIPVTEQHISKTPDLTGVNSNKFIKSILEMNDGIKLVLDVSKLINEHASEENK